MQNLRRHFPVLPVAGTKYITQMMSLQLLLNIVTIWPRIAAVGEFLLSEQTRSQPPHLATYRDGW